MSKYDRILHLSRPVSRNHPPMSRANRAAQFAPFAALTGYGDAVEEAGRQTGQRRSLEEGELQELNRRLGILEQRGVERAQVTLVYFRADPRKDGGQYVTLEGRFRQIDPVRRELVLEDWQRIPIGNLLSVASPLFDDEQTPDNI